MEYNTLEYYCSICKKDVKAKLETEVRTIFYDGVELVVTAYCPCGHWLDTRATFTEVGGTGVNYE